MSRPQVVVIGSGPGGAAIAWSLAEAGVKVRILEAGPHYKPREDYRLRHNDWERQHFPEQIPTKGRQTHAPLQPLEPRWNGLRSWNHVHGPMVKGNTRHFAAYSHVVGVGGTTLHYAGESQRLHPQAMQMHSRFGVAADWPFDYGELEPFYVQAERGIGVAGPANDPTRPRSAPYPMPEHAPSCAAQQVYQAFERMGLSMIANPTAANSQPYDRRPACNYCGQCARGCPRLDKGTADLTYVAKALATGNCTLDPLSPVLKLETGPNDRVTAAIYADAEGRQHRAEADLFVLACGTIETPRLLLNSASSHAPDGLANESGLVGKHFMETLYWVSSGLHPEPIGSYRGLPAEGICWDYNAPDAIPGVIGGVRFSEMTLEADFGGPISYARRVATGWGKAHKREMREKFGRMLSIGGMGESLPDPASYIDLDPQEQDAHGLPRARIHSHLAEMEIQRIAFIQKISRQALDAAGVKGRLEEFGTYDMFNATHVFGTARMGKDPETSVVDEHCRSHRWRNL
ncbi:MAG TPA: GMC family oxidoreductase, partial [Xanthomonadales bacterium]|nr:GMC family oxidoreductase [Xanthomonadales bacterium]